MVIAWPMPISRSRDSATPAMLMDRQEKKADPSTTMTTTPSSFSGLRVSATPSTADSTTIAAAWTMERTPAAKALPVISAARGVAGRSGAAGALQRSLGGAVGVRVHRLLLVHEAGAAQRRDAGRQREQRHGRGEHDDQAVMERLGDQLGEEPLPGQLGHVG